MNFVVTKSSNIKEGQTLYGIVVCSTCTYEGVHEIKVHHINYEDELVIFSIDQPCAYVYCNFNEMKEYVFETEDEALEAAKHVRYIDGFGLWYWDVSFYA